MDHLPDPQMQKCRKRLTSTRFLNLYRRILTADGIVNLKTDSPFLYEYTRRLVELNGFEVIAMTDDLYGSGRADASTAIKTYYEQQWLSRGKKIKLLSFRLPAGENSSSRKPMTFRRTITVRRPGAQTWPIRRFSPDALRKVARLRSFW